MKTAAKAKSEKTLLTVKTDKALKLRAQKTAEEIGIPLGTLVNAFLRNFVVEQKVIFTAPLMPKPSVGRALLQASKDFKEGKNISPRFTSAEAAIKWLHSRA